MPFARGAVVLQYVSDESVLGNADLVRFLCCCNMRNWAHAPPAVHDNDALYDAMLASPWNAADAVDEKEPPLVLLLGRARDREDRERVLAAVKHSSHNLRFVAKHLLTDLEVLAWAGAPREVKAISSKEALAMHEEFQAISHGDGGGGGDANVFADRRLDGRAELVHLRASDSTILR